MSEIIIKREIYKIKNKISEIKESDSADLFLKDLALVIEGLKSLLKRDFDMPHPMQNITDSFISIHTTKEGKKLTDINYGKILKVKRKDPPEKPIEFTPDFDLE